MAILYLCLVLISILSPLASSHQIGSSCLSKSTFTVKSFDINNWPLVKNVPFNFTMSGTFPQTEVVNLIRISMNYDTTNWNDTVYYINQAFTGSTLQNFTYTAPTGSKIGYYKQQITLEQQHTQIPILACWIFSYLLE